MADNYLITGYWGEPHVTAENDRGINAAMFGTGRFVLPVGEQFRAEYIGNNTIRMYDGKLMDNGAAAGIPAGEYVDLLIANAGQGKKRNDLIVFQYEQDASTLIESGKFVVIQGTETSGTASDPALTQEDLLSGNATFDQMALWRVAVSGTTISTPTRVAEVEWSNPPLELGVEYRTTERWKGRAVYTKLIDSGALPNNTSKSVATNITGFTGLVSISGAVMSGDSYNPINIIGDITDVWLNGTGTALSIKTKADLSSRSASICIKYTKG